MSRTTKGSSKRRRGTAKAGSAKRKTVRAATKKSTRAGENASGRKRGSATPPDGRATIPADPRTEEKRESVSAQSDAEPAEAFSIPESRDESQKLDSDETWISRRKRPSLNLPFELPDASDEPASLVVISHPESSMLGGYFSIQPGAAITIGRSPDVEVSFPSVMEISRCHARITRFRKSTTIEDLDSRNGTFINGERLKRVATLRNGDVIEIQSVKLKFFLGDNIEQAYHEALYQLAILDELTRIYNRRGYETEVERDFARARRHGRPLSLIIFDIDGFKEINDQKGHPAGDAVLKQIARLVEKHLRREEIFARTGGDEFVVLCPEVTASGSLILAERLRDLIAKHPFECEGHEMTISCSFGVADLTPEMKAPSDLYAEADRLLYRSKERGRNMVSSVGDG